VCIKGRWEGCWITLRAAKYEKFPAYWRKLLSSSTRLMMLPFSWVPARGAGRRVSGKTLESATRPPVLSSSDAPSSSSALLPHPAP